MSSKCRILPFASCSVLNPMNAIIANNKRFCWAKVSVGAEMPVFYNFPEVYQMVSLLHGERDMPQDIRPFCDMRPQFEPIVGSLNAFNIDAILVEPNAPIAIEYGDWYLNRASLITQIMYPIRAAHPDSVRVTSVWFNKGLMTCNETTRVETSEEMIKLLPADMPRREVALDILKRARGVRALPSEGMKRFRADFGHIPMGVVMYSFQYMPDGRPASWPPEFQAQVEEATRECKLPMFDPSQLVLEHGVANALEADLRHYKAAFLPAIADGLIDFAISLRDPARIGRRARIEDWNWQSETTGDPRSVVAGAELWESGRVTVDPRQPALRPYPFPFKAAIAFCNDSAWQSAEAFFDLHDFLNGTGPTAYGDGLGLEVGDGVTVDLTAEGHRLAVAGGEIPAPMRERLCAAGEAGWLDTLRLTEPMAPELRPRTRDRLDRALTELDRLRVRPAAHIADRPPDFSQTGGPDPWTDPDTLNLLQDFGVSYFGRGGLGERHRFGDHIDHRSPNRLQEVLDAYDWRPVSDPSLEAIGVAMPRVAQDRRKLLLGLFNSTQTDIDLLHGGRLIAFKRFLGRATPTISSLPALLTSAHMDQIEVEGGAAIVAQRFGVKSLTGRAPARDGRRPADLPVLDQHARWCLEDLAQRKAAGKILVATATRLLTYLRLRATLAWTVERDPQRWTFHIGDWLCPMEGRRAATARDLDGLAFLVPSSAPEVVAVTAARPAPLAMQRVPDTAYPGCDCVHLPWKPLAWV